MSSRLDKNSKLPSGKAKESSSAGKSKAKSPTSPPESKSGSKSKSESGPKPVKSSKSTPSKPPEEARKLKPTTAKETSGRKAAEEKTAKSTVAPKTKSAAAAPVATKSAATTKSTAASKSAKTTAAPRSRATQDTDLAAAEGLGLEEFSIALIKSGETKERIWRTKSFHQMPVQREFGFPDVAPELPGQYHQDKLVLMPKDPEYMFCYWELTPNLIDDKAKEKMPSGSYRETLKINWESRSLFEPNFTFIPVFFWARKWYFGVPQVGQRYQVELGWLSDTGHFISIIRSNLSELPESWAVTQKRLSEQGDVLAYSARSSKMLGSSEHIAVEDTRSFVPEWNLSSESFSSSSWSRGPGDAGAITAAKDAATVATTAKAPSGKKPAAPKTRAVPARLEVSGKVLPGTKVSVGGKGVPTDGQGFFKTDFPHEKDTLSLELTDRSGASRSFAYDLKELVLA